MKEIKVCSSICLNGISKTKSLYRQNNLQVASIWGSRDAQVEAETQSLITIEDIQIAQCQ